MLDKIKLGCGIAPSITIYDAQINDLIMSAKADLMLGGVIKEVLQSENEILLNSITCYVKAYRGNDRSDTEKYLKLYGDFKVYLQYLTVEDLAILEELKGGVAIVEP